MSKHFFWLIIFSFLVAGCSAKPTPAPTIVRPVSTHQTTTNCQQAIDAQMPADFLTDGSIIFQGNCNGKTGLYKLSATSHRVEPFLSDIATEEFPSYSVSKDRQWFLVEKSSYNKNNDYLYTTLYITGENDHSVIQYPMQRGWLYADDLYNNGQIGGVSWLGRNFTKYVLDPFTAKVSQLDYDDDVNKPWDHSWADLSPAMTEAVYGTQAYPADKPSNYVLKNITTGKILWPSQAETEQIYASYPTWSPDGSSFATTIWEGDGVFQLIAVDQTGKQSVASERFHIARDDGYINLVDLQWSSTGKYLSFWRKTDQGKKELVFWLPATNQIIYPGFQTISDYDLPTFSPDDREFLLHQTDENGQGFIDLVQLSSGKITRLDLDLIVITWLKTRAEIAKPANELLTFPLSPKNGISVKQIIPKEQTASLKPFAGQIVFARDKALYTFSPDKAEKKLADASLAYVSPNQKTLFYWYRDENSKGHYWLYERNKQPNEVITDKIMAEFAEDEISGWQNNDELWVKTRDDGIVLFNPFKNSFRSAPDFKWPKDYPEQMLCWAYCQMRNTNPSWLYTNYDKSLERYIYIASELMMQDRAGNIIWKYDKRAFAGFNMPKWSPDDQRMVVPLPLDDAGEHYEIFSVDRNGLQTQLTDYSAAYPTLTIEGFSWSPNGQYIAFWGDTHLQENVAQQNPYRLFVLDIVSRQTIDYGVAGSYANAYRFQPPPVWSPDNQHIAIQSILDGKQKILLLDFASQTITTIADGNLIGWMTDQK